MKRLSGSILLFAALSAVSLAQSDAWTPFLQDLKARPLGPTTMGGRVVDIAVVENDPRIFYVASASGGLWKTTNAGLSFAPIFDQESTVSLGAVAVAPKDPNVVYVGTGEGTSRNSVAWGDGVYRSADGGKTWTKCGLEATRHINKIVVDPRDPNVVYVAALGRLWGPNPERGLYKSTDGGKTWALILKGDDQTGACDIAMEPGRPDTLLVSLWARSRKAYDFVSGGMGSGLFKTTNGGKTWRKITKGVPLGPLGRIGLAYSRSEPKNVVATIEYKPDPKREPNRPKDGGVVRMNGGGTFASSDGGETWRLVSTTNPRPFYFSTPRIDPNDPKKVYLLAVSLMASEDGGKTIKARSDSVHPDWHAFWQNPKDSNHIIAGTDGGAFQSRDGGTSWQHLNGLPIGQYYAIGVDMRRPYWVYGGLQDNSCWGIPTQSGYGSVNYFDANPLGGGDGFYCQADPNDWRTVYGESQGGAAFRVDLVTGQTRSIRPRAPQGEKYRFNWSTPYFLSPHNSRTVYLGGHRLFKSANRGDTWTPISPDLTTNDPAKQQPGKNSVTPEDTGAEAHCTITTTAESPTKPGLLWAGTDDGKVWVTQNDGRDWTDVTANLPDLPANTWCSRVLPSKWAEGRAYATFDGHRSNDFRPYVYVTEDFGKTWKSLAASLPEWDSIYVIREGEKNPDLLYLGSEMSLRVSLDRGQNWTRYRTGFPTVAVHDLVVHPRELDLVIATHGRSIWTLDASALEQLDAKTRAGDVALLKPQDVLMLGRTTGSQWDGDSGFNAPNSQPGTRIQFFLKAPAKAAPTITITDPAGGRSTTLKDVTNKAGLNVATWNGRLEGRLSPGDYRVTLNVDGKEYITTARVEEAYLNRG